MTAPSFSDLLAYYGRGALLGARNVAADAPALGDRIVSDAKALPGMADTGLRALLGGYQHLQDALPAALAGPQMLQNYRPTFDSGVSTAADVGRFANRVVGGTANLALDAAGVPRGQYYDPTSTEMAKLTGNAIANAVQAAPGAMAAHPLTGAYELAKLLMPAAPFKVGKLAFNGARDLAVRARGVGRGVSAVEKRGLKGFAEGGSVPDQAPEPWQSQYADPAWRSRLTKLSPKEETQFQAWVAKTHAPITDDYDMKGFWKSGASTKVNQNDGLPHYTDTFKTPLHNSFSGQSIYSRPDIPKPTWNDLDQLIDPSGRVLFDERSKGFALGGLAVKRKR